MSGETTRAADENPFLAGDARGEEGILVETFTHASTRVGSKVPGQKSSPTFHLVGVHGIGLGVDASSGSAPTTWTDGLCSLRYFATPEIVPRCRPRPRSESPARRSAPRSRGRWFRNACGGSSG